MKNKTEIGYDRLCWNKVQQSVRLHSAQFGAAEFQRWAAQKMKKNLLMISLMLLPFMLSAEELTMQCSPAPDAGDCFTVHARMFLVGNGIIFRMWPVGTKRQFGLSNDVFHPQIEKYLDINTAIYGDYLVCPQTKERPGFLRWVCIESAKRLVVDRFDPENKTSKVFRLVNTWK